MPSAPASADDKAVYAYLPRLIRYYLDEDAILPNVETHICGEEDGLRLHPRQSEGPGGEAGRRVRRLWHRRRAARLGGGARGDPRTRLRADPANYISQPMVRLSVCPTLVDDGVRPRHVDLRPFAVTGREHLGAAGRAVARGAAGGLADRQFVAGRRVERHVGPCLACWRAMPTASIWMARYVERAENLARILDVTQSSARRHDSAKDWAAILEINSDLERFPRPAERSATRPSSTSTCSDAANSTSILHALTCARENARTLRPFISTEMWSQLNVALQLAAAR